jgi:putative ABC transport system ATP-binding protein/lipoprotein-releasing system ATP-binding protein
VALRDFSLALRHGESVAILGPNGAGKSTLLYIISSLDTPSEGKVEVSGKDMASMSPDDLNRFRNEEVGFVFQFHYLLAELNMIDNVLMPALKFRRGEERRAYAEHLLDRFGLKDKFNRHPRQLSGGEQQRVAIARALVMEPKFLFADEPTGSLDSMSGDNVMDIFRDVNKTNGTTIVLVTHDPDYANQTTRQIRLSDGKIAPLVPVI